MINRLLCCSDTHGRRPPPLDDAGAVAWLHGGDISDGPSAVGDDADPFADPLRAPVAQWFVDRMPAVLAVKGNHDCVDDFRAFRSMTDVTGRVVKLADRLFVAGVGWHGERYFELPTESDLKAVCDAVERQARRLVMPRDRLVLLTHYPPRLPDMRAMERDVRDGGTWYDCVRELAESVSPVAIVQGHVHSWSGTSQTVELGGRSVVIFHPGRGGGTLLIDVDRDDATVEWP